MPKFQGNGNGGFSSASGGWKGLGVTPICRCGDVAMIRTARTTRNAGKKFWGCPNFKEEIKNLLGVIISSGVEKMILTKEMVLSSAKIGRFVV
ncbi:hypothetical protein DEO72_LG2g4568 [Vigna unguiculata]|uniref:GRF-type domain-containing protein n=1 Tax=Vigna unguiculata TaxID=3917 RepID=A0A4D6L6U4_VIGUN|nr:hypothetical protein DEO72_LG2g4568 [Vigna unguiculata]